MFPETPMYTGKTLFAQISIVAPACNKADGISECNRRLADVRSKLADRSEVIYVNDGSRDGTFDILQVAAMRSDYFCYQYQSQFWQRISADRWALVELGCYFLLLRRGAASRRFFTRGGTVEVTQA
jgi:glycosyltransferase involved in cell wall biosynthesis